MFKEYCHISSLTQCYITINPITLLILKKKRYLRRPRARAKKQEYTLRFAPVYTCFPHPQPSQVSFCVPQPHTAASRHFNLNPFGFAPTSGPTRSFLPPTSLHHLASILSFLSRYAQSTRLAPQTTRLRLRQLNKPR
jgi:hypothetical protein